MVDTVVKQLTMLSCVQSKWLTCVCVGQPYGSAYCCSLWSCEDSKTAAGQPLQYQCSCTGLCSLLSTFVSLCLFFFVLFLCMLLPFPSVCSSVWL